MRLHTIVALALAFSSLIVLGTTCATRAETANTNTDTIPRVEYRDALKTCSVEWKASDARKETKKGEGQKAWNTFRANCVVEKGYVPTRRSVTRSDAKAE